MKTIYFIDGTKKEVSNEVAEKLSKNTIKGCGKFQSFFDHNNNLLFIINLDHIIHIS